MERPPAAAVLALLALVVLAGCSAAGSLSMEPVTDAELAEHASRSLEPTSPGTDVDDEARMLESAFANGSATIEATAPPVRAGLPFEYDGAYYGLSHEVVDERTATSVAVEIDYNSTEPTGQGVAYTELPAADRRALDALLPPRDDRKTEGYDFGAATTYDDAELERSVLVAAGRTEVVFEGKAYPVRVDGTREITVNTYRYTATRVANSSEAYARAVKDEHLFTLAGLSQAERSVVDAAIGDYYHAEDTDDAAFRSLLDRFERHDPVASEEAHGEWLARYDGGVYWVDLWYDGFET